MEDLQSHLSALLSNAHTSEGVSPSPSIVPCNAKQPVACPVCGVYFDSMRHMLSHQARQHGCQLPKVPLPKSTDYTAHTVQGLPQCKHCLGIFTRVEAFKKASAAVLSCTSRRDAATKGNSGGHRSWGVGSLRPGGIAWALVPDPSGRCCRVSVGARFTSNRIPYQ